MAAESGFAILVYREKVPTLAACTRCQLKFFTPTSLMGDSEMAREYLSRKFEQHHCSLVRKTEAFRDFFSEWQSRYKAS